WYAPPARPGTDSNAAPERGGPGRGPTAGRPVRFAAPADRPGSRTGAGPDRLLGARRPRRGVAVRRRRLRGADGITGRRGGPGRSKIRHRVRHGLRRAQDERRDLWRSFLEVVQIARPPAVVMENVPDMALDREMFIVRAMVHELEAVGYSVEEKVIETLRYGV